MSVPHSPNLGCLGAVRRHLDADEAVVLGAGLFAANLSTTFRLRKFGMADGAVYPVQYQARALLSIMTWSWSRGNSAAVQARLPSAYQSCATCRCLLITAESAASNTHVQGWRVHQHVHSVFADHVQNVYAWLRASRVASSCSQEP